MPKISSTLQALLRSKPSLPHPTNAGFDLQDWSLLASSQSARDNRLFDTMAWTGAQFDAFRHVPGAADHSRLGARLSTLAAVANSNLETHNVHVKHREAMRLAEKSTPGEIGSFQQLAALPIETSNGQSMDLDSYVSTVVDAVESWLFDAHGATGPSAPKDALSHAGGMVRGYGRHYSLRRAISDLWQQALWEDWYPAPVNDRWLWSPADRSAAERFFAWYQRSMEISASYGLLARSDWTQMDADARRKTMLSKTVVSVSRVPGRRAIIAVGRPVSNPDAGWLFGSLETLRGSYLAEFLDEPFPACDELTLAVVLRCWGVVRDLADQLAKGRKVPRFTTDANIAEWALSLDKGLIADALRRALDLTPTAVEAVLELLSWAPRQYKGLWGAPLVPVPGTSQLAIVHSILQTGNIVRSAEIWLQAGGLKQDFSKSGFGIRYEANLRNKFKETVKANSIVIDATVAPHAIKKSAAFGEEVDVLIQWGELLIVGEIKCYFFPSDPSERYYYGVHLEEAAEQAKRKAGAISASREVAAKALNLPVQKIEKLTVLPLVIVNQGFGSGMEIEGCLIADERFLDLCLGSGSFTSGGVFQGSGPITGAVYTTLYKTENEAWSKFREILLAPPTLVHASSQLGWITSPFPDALNGTIWLERQVPKAGYK